MILHLDYHGQCCSQCLPSSQDFSSVSLKEFVLWDRKWKLDCTSLIASSIELLYLNQLSVPSEVKPSLAHIKTFSWDSLGLSFGSQHPTKCEQGPWPGHLERPVIAFLSGLVWGFT